MGKLGSYNSNTIVVGDCLDIMAAMPNGCVDLVFADPFYVPPNMFDWILFDEFYWSFNQEWLRLLQPKVKQSGHIFISFSSEDMAHFEDVLKSTGYDIKSRIVWHYRNAGGRCRAKDRFGKTYQFVFHCSFGAQLNFPEKWDDRRFDVWTISTPQSNFKEGKYHEFQKPLELLKRIIQFSSKKGDLVFDPFIGSGTTAVAADRLGRRFFGCDINPDCVKMTLKRLKDDRENRAQLPLQI